MKSQNLSSPYNQMGDIVEKIKLKKEIWDLYTKKEEYKPSYTDQHDRFLYCLSKHRNVFEPAVSKFCTSYGLNPEYPENKNFAVCLTHDIDEVYLSMIGSGRWTAKALIRGKLSDAFKIPFSKIKKSWNPLWNFKEIMELEEKYGAISSFYFLALDPEEEDFSFRLEDLEHEIGNISDRGWEVGLHGGHESYKNPEDVKQKKKKLEKVLGKEIIGYRNHYLKFKAPDTWEFLRDAGIKYDSTFGYADSVGFRNGMCHPFRPYNLNTGKEIEILEIPLTIMDFTLGRRYMNLDFKNAWELAKQLIDEVEKYRGVVTILWHNSYMQGENLKLYEKILEYCSEKNAWLTSGEEICNHWESEVRE